MSWYLVDNTQSAERMTGRVDQGHTRVEANIGSIRYERIILKAGVFERIRDFENIARQNRVRAKRVFPRGFADLRQ